MLSAERERQLLVSYHNEGSKSAMDELVRSHMPIIFRVAGRSAQNPGVDINDLIQTATEGLLIAINRWSFEKSEASGGRCNSESRQIEDAAGDVSANGAEEPVDMQGGSLDAQPSRPTPDIVHSSRLATYALWWMRIMLTNSVIETRGVVVRAKSPKVRKALFGLPGVFRKLEISLPLSGTDVTRIAASLGIEEQYIEEALIHASGDVMLDEPVGDGNVLRGDNMADDKVEGEGDILARMATADSWDAVCEALMDMSSRDRFILITRYLLSPKWKLDRLSETLKMSRERIRQIGCDGLARIRCRVGPEGARHNPARRHAAEQLDALVTRIERASESSDPADLLALLQEQRITLGSTRVMANRVPLSVVSVAAPIHRC